MARLPRLTLAGHAHCLRLSTVHGQPLAVDAQDEQALLAALRALAPACQVAVWAYAIEPQALACLLCPQTDDGIGRFVQALGRRYVQAFNQRHGRRGALWASRYRAALLEPGEWVLAGMLFVERPAWQAQWPGSSAHHLGRLRDPLLSEPPAYWSLGNTPFEREDGWRLRLEQGLDAATTQRIAHAVQGGWALGAPGFVTAAAAAAGRPAQPRRAGRPRIIASSK
jgi:putative transposase